MRGVVVWALAGALPLCATQESPEAAVDQAILKGLEALRKGEATIPAAGTLELTLLTYLHAGVPENAPGFQALLQAMLSGRLERTYTTSPSRRWSSRTSTA